MVSNSPMPDALQESLLKLHSGSSLLKQVEVRYLDTAALASHLKRLRATPPPP